MSRTFSTKQIWVIAYPIILSSIAQNILNVTDTIFLGRLGEVALGAGVIGGLFYNVLLMFGWGMALGGQIIIARRLGEKKDVEIGKVHTQLIYGLVVTSLLLTFLVYIGTRPFLNMAVSSVPIREAGKVFLHYRTWGLLFAFLCYSFNSYYVGIAKTKVLTIATLIMVSFNVVFDYGLIFGHFGLPKMGIAGAAMASAIAEVVCTLFLFGYTYFYNDYKHYGLFRFGKLSKQYLSRILNVSVPLMFQFFLSIFVWLVFFLFIEKMGELPLAASNIIRSVYIVLMIPIWGFASATNTIVSQLIGKGKSDEVISTVRRILTLSVSSVAVLAGIVLIFSSKIIRLYTSNNDIVTTALPVIPVIALGAVGMAMAFVLFNAVSGTGNTRTSLLIEVVTLAVYLSYAYFLAGQVQVRLPWVWTAEILYGIGVTTASLLYLASKRWLGKQV